MFHMIKVLYTRRMIMRFWAKKARILLKVRTFDKLPESIVQGIRPTLTPLPLLHHLLSSVSQATIG